MYLVKRIIDKCERSKGSQDDWRQGASGVRSLKIRQSDYDKCGKSALLEEAQILSDAGLIQIKRQAPDSDIERISYHLERLEQFYQLLQKEEPGRISKQQRIWDCQALLNKQLEELKSEWIRRAVRAVQKRLDKGDIPKLLKEKDIFLPCLQGLDELKEPVYKRIFSKKYLQNPGTFEKKAQSYIISLARRYCDDVEPQMSNGEVLSQIHIKEYSQEELSLKGPLTIEIVQGQMRSRIHLSQFYYGTSLNSETLKNLVICAEQPDIERIITIENKASFMAAPFEKNTLYILSSGYFTPQERDFLRGLCEALKGRQVQFFHTGDLDYEGIKIFNYIKKKIFPGLLPFMMDRQTYEQWLACGEPIARKTLKKLENEKVPELKELIEAMLEKRLAIQQECFLL